MAGNTVNILIKADDKASQTIDDIDHKAGGLGKTLGDVTKIAGGFVLAQGFMQAPSVIGGFISSASAMNETLSKSNTIFGDQGKAIEQWASGAARDFGQSKQQALEAAASFGNMFTQLGIGTDVAADMSTQMVELASDFASFHNADITEVLNAQQAAFRGEYDALQRFVPTINAASVEQKALQMTGKELTSELTQQEKALAVQALMMEGAGAAAGDFDRTSNSLANQQRQLTATWDDAKAKLGEVLIPAMNAAVGFILNDFIPGVQKFLDLAAPYVEDFSRIVGEQLARFKVYYQEEVKPALDNIVAGIENVVGWIREHWPEIERIVVPIIKEIQNQIELAVTIITGVFDILIKLIQGDFSGAWDALKTLIGKVWDSILESIENKKDLILGVLATLKDLALAAFGELKDKAIELITNLKDKAIEIAGALKEGAVSKVTELKDGAVETITGAKDRLVSLFGEMKDGAIGKLDDLRLGILGKGQEIINTLGDVFGRAKDWVGTQFSGLADVVKGPINAAIGFINRLIGAWNGLTFSVGGGSFLGVSIPSLSFGTPDLPTIPLLAKGGIVTRPTLAMIGESGREAVIPLDRAGAMGNQYVYHINVQALDGRGAADLVLQALVQLERRGGVTPGTTRAVV